MDFVRPSRSVPMSLISGRGHYDTVISAVLEASLSVWIATANLKELKIEDARARPGVRRGSRRTAYRSVLDAFDELATRGVELRLLHAGLPSGPFARELAAHPRLRAGGLAMRICPRVHFKTVIVDGAFLYLGSANWTGAGLGARGSGRRNFELGLATDDPGLLDEVQAVYDRLWQGGECKNCKLRAECDAPLDTLHADEAAPDRVPRQRARSRRGDKKAAR